MFNMHYASNGWIFLIIRTSSLVTYMKNPAIGDEVDEWGLVLLPSSSTRLQELCRHDVVPTYVLLSSKAHAVMHFNNNTQLSR